MSENTHQADWVSLLEGGYKYFIPTSHQFRHKWTFASTYPYQHVSAELLKNFKDSDLHTKSSLYSKKKYVRVDIKKESFFIKLRYSSKANHLNNLLMKQFWKYNKFQKSFNIPDVFEILIYADTLKGEESSLGCQMFLGDGKTTFVFYPKAHTRIVHKEGVYNKINKFFTFFEINPLKGEDELIRQELFFWFKRDLTHYGLASLDRFAEYFKFLGLDYKHSLSVQRQGNIEIPTMSYYNFAGTEEFPGFSMKIYFPSSDNYVDVFTAKPTDSAYFPKFELRIDHSNLTYAYTVVRLFAGLFFKSSDFVSFGNRYFKSNSGGDAFDRAYKIS